MLGTVYGIHEFGGRAELVDGCLLGLREIGERVGLHYGSMGNAIQQAKERPSTKMADS